MNLYIALVILAALLIWLLVAIESLWEGGRVISMILSVIWFVVGVIVLPLEMVYDTKLVPYSSPVIECTSRMCEVEVFGEIYEITDAYEYNMLKDSTFNHMAIEYNYSWWGNVLSSNLIIDK